MPRKAISRIRAAAPGRPSGPSGTSSSQRLQSLRRQHHTLLRKIANKQKEIERLKGLLEEAEQQLHQRVEPIAARCRRKNEEIWSMFEALLTSVPTKRGRRAVREVFQALVSHGVVLPVETELDAEFGSHGDPDGGQRDGAGAPLRPSHGGYSAAPRGAEPGRDTLKAVFKRLTVAFHPDRTQDATEKLRRTALMQSVTQAYQIGDLASLLRLEDKSRALDAPAATEDDAAQCLEMQRVLDELRAQLSELKGEARQLERAEAFQFFSADFASHPGKSLDGFVRSVEAELDELTRVCDFVRAFREKKLTLEEFLCGPVFRFGGAEFDFDDLLRGNVVEASDSGGRTRRGAGRKRRRR